MTVHAKYTYAAAVAILSTAGCATPRAVPDADGLQQACALLMPTSIEIVEPFTRIRSFDEDSVPDGIQLLVQAVNSLDSAVMIVGHIRAELFEYVAASAVRQGRRLEHWDMALATEDDQRTFWNQITQMYEFRLKIDPTAFPVEDRYVLMVTYSSPLGDHLTAECVLERPKTGDPLGGG
ncbi:MAG: hypothetical protein KJ749_14205 [Planctomycetes bacterium]|nr:hypothetical protein [Planctomycetota bacterium]